MTHEIYNFVNANAVSVEGYVHDTCGRLVTLIQRAGSLGFQFSMRPAQARALAAALTIEADALEAQQAAA